jgi:hypothetical protein
MSQSSLMALIDAFLQDPEVGLAATVEKFAALSPRALALGPEQIRTDFRFVDYQAVGVVQPTGLGPSVIVETVEYRPRPRIGNSKDAMLVARITVEYSDAAEAVLLANRDVCADALGTMLGEYLVDYSAAHNSTVVEVPGEVAIQEGQFQGAVTSGLVAVAQILERTSYVP